MESVATTRMSSKGQIVIPETIRKKLNLKVGAQFIVVGEGDVVILKAIAAPSTELFEELIQKARQHAAASGLERSDVSKAVSKSRKKM
jgi:AbrB family looped-hinge helix DNA binding protein